MKTGKNKSTNNLIIRFWKKSYYEQKEGKKLEKWERYDGTVMGVHSKKDIHFHSPAQMLTAIEKLLKIEEKYKGE